MSVDYDGVGGIGIKLTGEMLCSIIENGVFTEEEFDNDGHGCLERMGINFSEAGSCFSGDLIQYFLVEGNSLMEINKNKDKFIKKLSKYGVIIEEKDLMVVSDLLIW